MQFSGLRHSSNAHSVRVFKSSYFIFLIFFHIYCTILKSSRPEVFCKKGVLRNFTKFTGKHLCRSLFFNKVTGLRSATLLKERLWPRYFPVNFAKFLRTPFLKEHLWWLLLNIEYLLVIFHSVGHPLSVMVFITYSMSFAYYALDLSRIYYFMKFACLLYACI